MPTTPEQRLWLAILDREKDLEKRKDPEVRGELRRKGFPDEMITQFLVMRSQRKDLARTKN